MELVRQPHNDELLQKMGRDKCCDGIEVYVWAIPYPRRRLLRGGAFVWVLRTRGAIAAPATPGRCFLHGE